MSEVAAMGRRGPLSVERLLYRIPQRQRRADDCVQASLAALLDLPIDDVPRFDEDANPGKNQNGLVRSWLETVGFGIIISYKPIATDGRYIACGPAPRGHHHAVVMQGQSLEFDPHPSGAGLTEIDEWWMIYPLDPAAAIPVRRVSPSGASA